MTTIEKKNKLEGKTIIAQQKYINQIFNDFTEKDIQLGINEGSLFGLENIDEDFNFDKKLAEENRDYFMKSNLKKFLHFVKLMEIKLVRIVSHSHTMINFIKFCCNNKIILEKLEDMSSKNNAWTIFLQSSNTKFIISRHGYSVANYLKNSKEKVAMIKEHDPSLSLWGILTLIYRSEGLHQEEVEYLKDTPELHNPSYINVSILIRTWMTAVCLYMGFVTGNKITLVVSPYLKEEGITYDNQPLKVEKQLAIFSSFFDYLSFLYESISVREESKDTNTFLGKIKLQLYKMLKFINNSNNQLVIKHLTGDYKLKYDGSNGYIFVKNGNEPLNIKIFKGVCMPKGNSLKKINLDCEFFASIYQNKCILDGRKLPSEASPFTNKCSNTQNGGSKKKKTNKKQLNKSKKNQK